MANNARRKLTRLSRFSCKATMVARPVGVKPITWRKSSLQAKCSYHLSCRGWKSGMISFVTASRHSVRVCLCPLHPAQVKARFSKRVRPPLARGLIWSAGNVCVAKSAGVRQYSQRPLARSFTFCRKAGVMRLSGIIWRLNTQLSHQITHCHLAQLCQFRQILNTLCINIFDLLNKPHQLSMGSFCQFVLFLQVA